MPRLATEGGEVDRVDGTETAAAETASDSVEFMRRCRPQAAGAHENVRRSLRRVAGLLGDMGSFSPQSAGGRIDDPDAESVLSQSAPQGRAGLSHQYESGVVSQGHCDGDIHGAVDQKAHDCDRSGTGGERGREQP